MKNLPSKKSLKVFRVGFIIVHFLKQQFVSCLHLERTRIQAKANMEGRTSATIMPESAHPDILKVCDIFHFLFYFTFGGRNHYVISAAELLLTIYMIIVYIL